ncbi:MAG: hypothetical protein JXB62_08045 [Pirellulales bacterium]|nr:hypothetical protein [Pirellulales bacterium]
MAKRAIHDDQSDAHFVTLSCYRRRRLLGHDRGKLTCMHENLARAGLVAQPCD